jgi:dTDP-4-dehydrorhamnose reductase
MQRILLTGAAGQVGQELQSLLAPLGTVTALGREAVDFADPPAVQQVISGLNPQVIVNAAAYTAVDKAESEPDLAELVNHTAVTALAKAAHSVGAKMLHISTDYVFDGTSAQPYREDAATHPLGVYGASKLRGEQAVLTHCPNSMVVRTAWVYGCQGKGNFVKTMLRLGAERQELKVVSDQIGAPTWSKDLAGAIAQMVPLLGPDTAGIYHYTNSGVTSWYDFAVAIFEEARALGFPLAIERVLPIPTSQYPTPAHRPGFSVLSLEKTAQLLGEHPPQWRQSLRKMLAELK